MKIYIGADHNGFAMKSKLIGYLKGLDYEVIDGGDKKLKTEDDFPQFGARVAMAVLASSDEDPRGILICASGQGMCIAANRFNGIRASLVWDLREARMSRNDDDSNILCLPAKLLETKQAETVVNTWLNTPFAGAPRFKRRIKELDELV